MRNVALADVTADHIREMRQENETLFVEFKSSVDGDGYKVAEAVASFSNTLGGWVLVGLRDDGTPSGWVAPQNLTDRVRQILARWLDPLPAFAARLCDHDGDLIGLVRVYELADTPHVLKNGKVVVRSVAEVRKQTQVYRPGGSIRRSSFANSPSVDVGPYQTRAITWTRRGRSSRRSASPTTAPVRGWPRTLRCARFRLWATG
jgi:predicted HTH transcriptional regulator